MNIKWIKLDNKLVAIDKDTGEILDESLDTLPAGYDVNECVMDVLAEMFGSPLNTTAEIKEEKRGRKAKEEYNPYTSFFSNVHYNEDTGTSSMDTSVEDLVYSAATVNAGNTRIPVKQLIYVMRSEQLSTKGIQELLNKRRIIKGGKPLEERYCRDVRAAAESLIKRINTHQDKGTINLNDSSAFQFDEDRVAHERSMGLPNAMLCPVEFTEGDKRTIRALARAGNIEAINDYLQRVTEHSGRMMQRILGKPASEDSKKAYMELHAEFPYEPYEENDKYVTRKKELQVSVDDWMYQIGKYEEYPAMDGITASVVLN
ncbi:hypothetical protein [Pantoea piersonii]|uniref:hypothetical protein n=2 Tax=Pantoea piersonii TaxID=2364647 RepID=UPI0028A89C5D|nr:hypothetical protein [Pantoea piersonii]